MFLVRDNIPYDHWRQNLNCLDEIVNPFTPSLRLRVLLPNVTAIVADVPNIGVDMQTFELLKLLSSVSENVS